MRRSRKGFFTGSLSPSDLRLFSWGGVRLAKSKKEEGRKDLRKDFLLLIQQYYQTDLRSRRKS